MAAQTHGRQESAANLKDNNTDENERQCIIEYNGPSSKYPQGAPLTPISIAYKMRGCFGKLIADTIRYHP